MASLTFLTFRPGRLARVTMAALLVAFCLPGCSTVRSVFDWGDSEAGDSAPSDPKFAAPGYTGQGAPNLASVPDDVPVPTVTRREHKEILEGLIADRRGARYTDQMGRIAPIDVRPLTELPPEGEPAPAAPPKAEGAPVGAVTKLETMPEGAGTSTEHLADMADIPPPPPMDDEPFGTILTVATVAAAGPQIPAGALQTQSAPGPRQMSSLGVRSDGFRALHTYERGAGVEIRLTTIDFGLSSKELTAADRRSLADAAQRGKKSQGPVRVIARSDDASDLAQIRGSLVARELQRLGIAQDRIFVGTDSGYEGPVDVILTE